MAVRKYRIPIIAVIACLGLIILRLAAGGGEPFNVLLISLDTVRPDHLGCYGYRRIETPNVDALAQEGVLFEDALTHVPLTLPSHTSALTGLYPVAHGVRDNGTFILRDHFTTLAEVLAERGYATGAFVGTFILDSRYGLAQGFDVYHDRMEEDIQIGGFSHPERNAGSVTQDALAWLGDVEEPFFAFVHYYDPHTPYEPPAPYDAYYPDSPYDGEIAYTDFEMGKVIDLIRDRHLLKRTLVVLISDHGEGLMDHNERAHGILIYDTTIKIALILRLPDDQRLAREIETPLRINQPVEMADVLPTILDILGIDHAMEVDGRSVLPLLKGETLPPKVCYFESLYPYFTYRWSPLRGVRFRNWKFILAPESELYNLSDDPGETVNLWRAYPERAEQLRANLEDIASRAKVDPAAEVRLNPEEVRKLQALGYVSAWRPAVPIDTEPEGTDPKTMIVALQDVLGVGMETFAKGEYEESRQTFARLAEIDPMNPKAHVFLGRCLMEMGELEAAEAEFLKVIEIDSTHSQAFFRLGNIARLRGDLDLALLFYRVAAGILPETPDVLTSIGAILVEKGLPDSGMIVLEQALEMDPYDENALINLGISNLAMERHDEALYWFNRTLDANPQHVKALANIASIFIQRGRIDSAIVYLERARDAAPRDATILRNLGSAYRQIGMVKEARETFEAALDLDADNVQTLFGLAGTRLDEGMRTESIAILERIRKIDPDFEPARIALEKILSGT